MTFDVRTRIGRQARGWIVAGLTIALGACDLSPKARGPGPSAVRTLRYGSLYAAESPFGQADREWIAYVEKASGGRLRVQPYWGASLISAGSNIAELRHGVVDVAMIAPIYTRGGVQASRAQSGYYGSPAVAGQVAVYHCLEREFPVLDAEFPGLRVLAAQGGNLPTLLTRNRPVRTLAQLRGLRLRAPSEIVPVLRSLGVDAVTMPMGEAYSALSKGIIDGLFAPPDALKSMNFADLVRYRNTLSVKRGAYPARAIAEPVFESLPPDLRQVLLASGPIWEAALSRRIEAGAAKGVTFGAAHGVTKVDFEPASQRAFDAAYDAMSLRQAAELARYGIDGARMLARARALDAAGGCAPPIALVIPIGSRHHTYIE